MLTKKDMVGTWKIVSYTLTDDGKEYYPFSKECEGYLIYTEDGHVSAQLSTPDRSHYASGDLHEGSLEEMAEAAHGYMAYCGTYEVFPEKGQVMHKIDVSMNPTWEKQSQVRYVNYDGRYLSITADVNTAKLVWEKAN